MLLNVKKVVFFLIKFSYNIDMKRKILLIINLVLCVITFLYGISILNVNSGTLFYLIWFLISIFFLTMFILIKINFFDKHKTFKKIFIIILAICLGIFLIIESLIISKMNIKNVNNLDYIIVLGAQVNDDKPSIVLKYRLDKAVSYLKENENTFVIVSGGKGNNEKYTEASIMKKYLIENGINEERIIIEDKSHTTKENLINSKKLTRDNKTIGIVTNNFHMYRALLIGKKYGVNAKGLPAGSNEYYLPNNLLREALAFVKFLILG